MRDKVTRQCPQTTTFEVKGEPKQIRTEIPLLTSLTKSNSLGLLVSLTSTTTATHLELTKLLKLGVQSVTSFRRLARCIVGKTGDFSDFLINTSQYHVSISEACRLNKAYLCSCKYRKTKQNHCMSIKQAKLLATAVRLLTTRT